MSPTPLFGCGHCSDMAHAGLYSLPDPTKQLSRFGNFYYVSREIDPVTGKRKVKQVCNSKARLLLSAFVTIVSFGILAANYAYLNKPVIPIPIPGLKLSGSEILVPHTSVPISLSGLICESVTFDRAVRDRSVADLLWNVLVYLKPAHESLPSRTYDFSITNDNITLDEDNSWYMRYVYLHSGSNFTIDSCVTEGVQSRVKVCVLKGQKSYRKWLSDLYHCNGQEHVLNNCANETNSSTTTVSENDTYYFVHYAILNGSKISHLSMDVSVSSLDYDFSSLGYNVSCAESSKKSTEPCTSPIPFGFRGQAIITADAIADEFNNHSWSYEDTVYVSWNCAIPLKSYFILCIPYLVIVGCFNIYNLYVAINKEFKCWARIRSRKDVSDDPRKANILQECCNRLPFNPVKAYKKFNNSIKTKLCKAITSSIVAALILTFAEAISPILSYRTASNFVFAPGETQSFSISRFFCSSLSVDVVGSSHLSASLWITKDNPQLTVFTKETVTLPLSCDEENVCMIDERFYMHPGSNFTDIVVDNSASSGTVYFGVYSGEVTFVDLGMNPSQPIIGGKKYRITSSHFTGTNVIVLYSLGGYIDNATLMFEVNRAEYSTNIPSIEHCETHSYTATSCNVPVPFGAGYVNGLLQVAFDTEEHNELEYLAVNTKCNYRIDAWTLLWLPVLIFNFVVVMGFLIILYVILKTKSPIDSTAAPVSDITSNREGYGSMLPTSFAASPIDSTAAPVSGTTSNGSMLPTAFAASPIDSTAAPVSDTSFNGEVHGSKVITVSAPEAPVVEPAEATSAVPVVNPPPTSEESGETTIVHAVAEVHDIAEEEEKFPASESEPLIG